MEFRSLDSDGHSPGHDHRGGGDDAWAEALARTVAHLAAQLTVAQVRLRALATDLGERGVADPEAVAARVRAIAEAEAGPILRENLGEALLDVIDVEALENDLVAYLTASE
jgi:hypothetical protein